MGNVSCVADFFRGLSRGVGVQSGNSILFLSPPAFSDLPDLSVQPSFTFSCVNHLIFRYKIPVQYNTKLLLQFQVSLLLGPQRPWSGICSGFQEWISSLGNLLGVSR